MRRFIGILALALGACRSSNTIRLPDTGVTHSPDGRVVFIRATPDRLVATSLGDEQATELWIANADGTAARRLVIGRAADSVERTLAALSVPQFSPDGRRVYFLSRAWVTSDAVHAVEVATGREWFVAPGNSLAIIPRGPLAGCLLVSQHRYRPNQGGSYDWTWLLGSNGQELALAASDSDGADRRLATWLDGGIPEGAFGASRAAPSNERCN
jgi:dipeptidyl aminopeptidase/acylaminoacyl peptidase